MNMTQFEAYIEGYERHLFDFKCLTVHAGYWAGYYNGFRKTKSPNDILRQLCSDFFEYENSRGVDDRSTSKQRTDTDIGADVDLFLQREKRRLDLQRR